MSHDPVPFHLIESLITWAAITGLAVLAGVVACTLVLICTLGTKGIPAMFHGTFGAFEDLFGTSWRRVWALAMLTFREAVRRKTLLVLAVFGVLFLFAGWYLPRSGADPQQQVEAYVSFVL